jgi:DNA repair exonuclease SbcCD ATPase subunit
MLHNGIGNLMDKVKLLVAENQSLASRLNESVEISAEKDAEIARLKQLLAEANTFKIDMDSRLEQLQQVDSSIAQMQQLVDNTVSFNPATPSAANNSNAEADELKELNNYLQAELSDSKKLVKELKEKNSRQEQQIAALSQEHTMSGIITTTEDAEAEIQELKELNAYLNQQLKELKEQVKYHKSQPAQASAPIQEDASVAMEEMQELINLQTQQLKELKEQVKNLLLKNNELEEALLAATANAIQNVALENKTADQEKQLLQASHEMQVLELKEKIQALHIQNMELEERLQDYDTLQQLLTQTIEDRDRWKNFVMNKG